MARPKQFSAGPSISKYGLRIVELAVSATAHGKVSRDDPSQFLDFFILRLIDINGEPTLLAERLAEFARQVSEIYVGFHPSE